MAETKKAKVIIDKWLMRKMFKEAGYIKVLTLFITKNMLQI